MKKIQHIMTTEYISLDVTPVKSSNVSKEQAPDAETIYVILPLIPMDN